GLVLKNEIGQSALQMHPYVVELDKRLHRDSYKWERVIERFDENALQKMYDAHILDCGGSLESMSEKRAKTYKEGSALNKDESKSNFIEKAREKYPNAYKPWSKSDEKTLIEMFESGKSFGDLSKEFGRGAGGIKSRLVKLGLIEE
ncbi:MAG: hypothetical protein LRZ97_02030, partial [Candidatus Pacebacteria bacterium]|nr:hypothetical protein [Candidatus Paceibacterota bacterium]